MARVLKRLGADVTAIYPTGGALGQLLRRLVDQEGVPGLTTPVSGETREDFTVIEQSTGRQYRFVLPGPQLSEQEWRACLDAFTSLDQRVRFVVGSGSLPPGEPDDFYGRIAQAAKQAGQKARHRYLGGAIESHPASRRILRQTESARVQALDG